MRGQQSSRGCTLLNKNETTCLIYFAIISAIVAIGLAINNVEQTIENLKMVGVCLGVVLLVFLYGLIAGLISAREYNTLQILSREYPVRCQITQMKEDLNVATVFNDIPDEPENNIATPIFCTMAMASHGVCITRSKVTKEQIITADPNIRFGLFQRDKSNPLIISANYKLYCIIHKRDTDSADELAYAGLATYTDELAKISSKDQLEIVLLFRDYIQKGNLNRLEYLDQPLKLKIIVLNDARDYDAVATFELYKNLYERLHPEPPDEDDSWMYRSRPVFW